MDGFKHSFNDYLPQSKIKFWLFKNRLLNKFFVGLKYKIYFEI